MAAIRSIVATCIALSTCVAATAQPELRGPVGSTAFCLLEVPSGEPGKQRWINLGIVQYVEAANSELRIVYGGGNFGAGHELRLVYGSPEEAHAQIERMRQVAAACTAPSR